MKFNNLEEACEAFIKAVDEGDNEVGPFAYAYILKNGPPELVEQLNKAAEKIIPPDGYDQDGNPLWTGEYLERELGTTVEEISALLTKHGLEHTMKRVDPAHIHWVQ
jgi:hypothetical protein